MANYGMKDYKVIKTTSISDSKGSSEYVNKNNNQLYKPSTTSGGAISDKKLGQCSNVDIDNNLIEQLISKKVFQTHEVRNEANTPESEIKFHNAPHCRVDYKIEEERIRIGRERDDHNT
jgi:hypothetical protein